MSEKERTPPLRLFSSGHLALFPTAVASGFTAGTAAAVNPDYATAR